MLNSIVVAAALYSAPSDAEQASNAKQMSGGVEPRSAAGQQAELKQEDLTRLVAKTKESLITNLLDPEAAKFRNVFVVRSVDGDEVKYRVCGEFIGKNAYGAYTGYKRFIGLNGKISAREDEIDYPGVMQAAWDTVCAESESAKVVWAGK
ncbi:MAG: hypothetical protein ABIJ73_08570 [Pseudomonadota bacterium]